MIARARRPTGRRAACRRRWLCPDAPGHRARAVGRRRQPAAGSRPVGATSMQSCCKSHIEYLARPRAAIPPRRNHSTGYLRGDPAPPVLPNRLRKQWPFPSAHNAGSKAQRAKRSTRSSFECNCGSRQISAAADCHSLPAPPAKSVQNCTPLWKAGSVPTVARGARRVS